ncbi:farnesyl-diphosphate farnesyltransferase [Haladaptatus sp. R4]|uniref:phytoene/squalene synthase family protein n=1 Tax=Haladaptatus sp. R4 TaxID=1679489 RepID=UPI0007B4B394|nr:phytoene/squalene synthase family protein [Haladaptatus sp. R4]KZN23813.1 farnesyl-diphosphate farnesyltransferase [Haladaptatus sp. R4]
MDNQPLTSATADEPPGADIEWCHQAVQGVSRTFAITIDLLDTPMADAICVGYLLCRVADTIEDAGHIPPVEQVRLLHQYDAVLDPTDATTVEEFRESVDEWIPDDVDGDDADWSVVSHAPRIVRTFDTCSPSVRQAVRPPVRELVNGMAMFVERYADTGGLRIGSRAELEEYCYYVAGTVGELITNLVCQDADSAQASRLRETSESFSLLLQLVNVTKDVYVDYHDENNVYLPETWLDEADVPQDKLCDPEHSDDVADVVARTADHAHSFTDDAQTYLETMPRERGNRLVAWTIPYLLAVGTLREVRKRPEDALRRAGIKVSREEVHSLIASLSGGVDRETLGELRRTISERPFHRSPNSI